MAVLNKVVEKYQSIKESSYASTDGSFSYPQSPSVTSERSSNSYYESTPETLSLTVEERIKEVTTRYITPEEDDYETNQGIFSKFLPNLNFLKGKRALFPEFGKDVVDGISSYCDDYEDDFDENANVEVINTMDSWEDNWLFQRKKLIKMKDTHHPVPVPMLVPNPSEDYRALIGDQDADDLSDLSECSDSVLEELIYPKIASDSQLQNKNNDSCDDDSGVNEPIIERYEVGTDLSQNKKYDDVDQDSSGVASTSKDIFDVLSSSSITQSDDECSSPWNGISHTDKVNNVQLDCEEGSLGDVGSPEKLVSDSSSKEENPLTSEIYAENYYHNEEVSSLPEELSTPPKPGTIAEREHKKWSEATPLAYNPYSKENIEKRSYDKLLPTVNSKNESNDREIAEMQELNAVEIHVRTLSVDYQKYSRDYYTNQDESLPNDSIKEVAIENGENSKPESDSAKLNGNAKKSKLVRVLSWSDRGNPQIKSNGNAHPRLPSVKELAKQFSGQQNELNDKEIFKPKSARTKQVHSLTARSMSREFREGLKQHNIGKTFNRNISSTDTLSEKCDDQDLNDTNEKIQECGATWEHSNGKC